MRPEVTIRVVLASDDTITREGLASLLRQAPGMEIIGQAHSMPATPKIVRQLAPDVALIEVSVPNRGQGLQAVAKVADESPETRIVVLTNNGDPPYVRSMLSAGASGYLLKNSETSQLFTAVRTARLGGRFIDPALGTDLVWHVIDRNVRKTRPVFSRRESEVFIALVRGYTNAQSADILKVSVKSIETYRSRIYRKLHLSTRAELVEYALAHGALIENRFSYSGTS